jgi:putative addiction module component (TIGR02574 family)
MTDLVAELTERAKALSPEDRARLAEVLLASLDPGEEEVDAAWDAEIRSRIAADVENGIVQLIPGEEGFAQVRQALRR